MAKADLTSKRARNSVFLGGLIYWCCARNTLSKTKIQNLGVPEHPKQDQNPKLTPLSETTSIPVCFMWKPPPFLGKAPPLNGYEAPISNGKAGSPIC